MFQNKDKLTYRQRLNVEKASLSPKLFANFVNLVKLAGKKIMFRRVVIFNFLFYYLYLDKVFLH